MTDVEVFRSVIEKQVGDFKEVVDILIGSSYTAAVNNIIALKLYHIYLYSPESW